MAHINVLGNPKINEKVVMLIGVGEELKLRHIENLKGIDNSEIAKLLRVYGLNVKELGDQELDSSVIEMV